MEACSSAATNNENGTGTSNSYSSMDENTRHIEISDALREKKRGKLNKRLPVSFSTINNDASRRRVVTPHAYQIDELQRYCRRSRYANNDSSESLLEDHRQTSLQIEDSISNSEFDSTVVCSAESCDNTLLEEFKGYTDSAYRLGPRLVTNNDVEMKMEKLFRDDNVLLSNKMAANKKHLTLLTLNGDCLRLLCEQLDLPDQLTVCYVCKRLRRVIFHIWQHNCKKVSLIARKYQFLKRNLEYFCLFIYSISERVEELDFGFISPYHLRSLKGLQFPNVKSLAFDDRNYGKAWHKFDDALPTRTLVKLFPQLTELKIRSYLTGKYLWNFKNLVSLDISHCDGLNSMHLKNIFTMLRLKKLSLLRNYSWLSKFDDIITAIKWCETLEELCIDNESLARSINVVCEMNNLRKLTVHLNDEPTSFFHTITTRWSSTMDAIFLGWEPVKEWCATTDVLYEFIGHCATLRILDVGVTLSDDNPKGIKLARLFTHCIGGIVASQHKRTVPLTIRFYVNDKSYKADPTQIETWWPVNQLPPKLKVSILKKSLDCNYMKILQFERHISDES